MLVLSLALILSASHPHPAVVAGPHPAGPAPSTYAIDQAHSEVTFRIRHFVTKVRGKFTDWSGTITGDPQDWSSGSVAVVIKAASINTANDRRDSDLRSQRFFNVDTFPEITFKSTKVEASGENVTITGDLSMRGVTKSVVLKGSYLGSAGGKQPGDKIGFEAGTTINRTEYGIVWNRAVEGGGVMLGDDVEISISIEANRQS
ncbi:MAG TPA: YceI family protein [Gemmatimonadales bacterium]|nr:YceI family protein [Gemmatimonadales bacterium]